LRRSACSPFRNSVEKKPLSLPFRCLCGRLLFFYQIPDKGSVEVVCGKCGEKSALAVADGKPERVILAK